WRCSSAPPKWATGSVIVDSHSKCAMFRAEVLANVRSSWVLTWSEPRLARRCRRRAVRKHDAASTPGPLYLRGVLDRKRARLARFSASRRRPTANADGSLSPQRPVAWPDVGIHSDA